MTATAPGDAGDAGPKKRLVIKKMVLENFKSYAGAQHVGPFHKVRGSASVARARASEAEGCEGPSEVVRCSTSGPTSVEALGRPRSTRHARRSVCLSLDVPLVFHRPD